MQRPLIHLTLLIYCDILMKEKLAIIGDVCIGTIHFYLVNGDIAPYNHRFTVIWPRVETPLNSCKFTNHSKQRTCDLPQANQRDNLRVSLILAHLCEGYKYWLSPGSSPSLSSSYFYSTWSSIGVFRHIFSILPNDVRGPRSSMSFIHLLSLPLVSFHRSL